MHKQLVIKGRVPQVPIIQGGMGVWVSGIDLAAAVALEGGIGVISTAALELFISQIVNLKLTIREAVYWAVRRAKENSHNGLIGVNIMTFLQKDCLEAAQGAIDAKVDFIFSGAGLPFYFSKLNNYTGAALVPIVSSAQAFKVIWHRLGKAGCRPDAVVLEGPLAGGHLGFKIDQVDNPENSLENLLPQIKELAIAQGDIPVIVAGGIRNKADINRFMDLGADGVQIGTPFVPTFEASAPLPYKLAVLNAKPEDIVVVSNSPCGFPFRVIKNSPMYQAFLEKKMNNICDQGYLLQKDKDGRNTLCLAKDNSAKYFCICNGLLHSAGHSKGNGLYTSGARPPEAKQIISVKQLMDGLK